MILYTNAPTKFYNVLDKFIRLNGYDAKVSVYSVPTNKSYALQNYLCLIINEDERDSDVTVEEMATYLTLSGNDVLANFQEKYITSTQITYINKPENAKIQEFF